MKKLITLLVLFMPMFIAAQSLEGTWKFHPTYQLTTANDLIDTENYVYALSNGAIVRLEKSSDNIEALSPATGLSDVKVKGIYYNYDKRYLLVVYANSNVDLLFEDGRIVNISAVADVIMNNSRTVNDVTFASGRALLATNFGLVVIDDTAMKVEEFRIYGKALASVAQVGGRMVIACDNALYASDSRRETLDDFTSIGVAQTAPLLRPIDDNSLFVLGTGVLKRCTFTEGLQCSVTTIVSATPNNLQRMPDGWLANFRSSGYYYTIKNNEAFTATKVTGNTSSLYSCWPDGDGTIVWQIDGNGIHHKGASSGYKPHGMYMRGTPFRLWYSRFNPWDGKFYVTTADQKLDMLVGNSNWVKHIFTYDGAEWVDDTPTALRSTSRLARISFIPGMSNSYFATDRSGNFYRVINGELKGTFKNKNVTSTLQYPQVGILEPALLVDHEGNLWMVTSMGTNYARTNSIFVLPKAKVLSDTVVAQDWIELDCSNFSISNQPQRQSFVETTTGVKVFTSGQMGSLLNIWRQKPGANSQTDIDLLSTLDFIDQSGHAVDKYQRETHIMAADSTGHVWVGGRTGVFYFKADEAFSPNFRVTIPIVHEGEEGPYAIQTTSIAVDPLNRKWIGTYESGLYVVSPDGSQVLKHFDVDNSNLPSSFIHEVAATLERAIVVTENGVVEFDMNDIPNVIDYTAVTAAPMFVEPSYTGFVTIGQVDVGACVRITDRDGNVVREFTATSNQVAWDTCDETGERVPTGVYNIYAGLTADQLPGTPQAKVKIIK